MNHRHGSLWTRLAPSDHPARAPLAGDRRVDVVVIGGGAAGLSIALRLRELGADVVVLERRRIGAGVTGASTAKVTALHGVLCSRIGRRHGPQAASAYVAGNYRALADIRATIERYTIACGLTNAWAVDYATTPAGRQLLDDESAALHAADMPVSGPDDLDLDELPFAVRGAVGLPGQAHLDPQRWCEGLAEAVGAGRVHENTPVLDVAERRGRCVVSAAHGTVHAEHAVIATHAPIVDPRYLTVRCRPHRSYALAARLDGEPPAGMYLSVDQPVRSLRPAQLGDASYLVVAGEGHPVGDEQDARECLATLEDWTREHFPVRSVDRRWAAHDQMPADDLPFIGRLTPRSHRWVATGFQKWGLTTGALAAAIIGSGIAGHPAHPAAGLFDPTRLRSTLPNRRLASDVGRVACRYLGDHLRILGRTRPADAVAPGDSTVIRSGLAGTALHRDTDGRLHAVSAVCTHEGCLVRFNRAEETWDCPCHGSRFTVDGDVLSGPAVDPLPHVEPPP